MFHSASGMDALKIEEMEKMLKEAQLEKARLIESRVSHKYQFTINTVTIFIFFFLFLSNNLCSLLAAGTRDSCP